MFSMTPRSLMRTGLALSSCEHSMGVREMATTVEVHTMMVTSHPSSLNIMPAIPVSIVRGTNTTTITRVVAMTDTQTSLVAYIAASLGLEPLSICFVMFSSTTIASSTTIPMATVKELSEMMFRELSASMR